MSVRSRSFNNVELTFSMRVASRELVGHSDPTQFDLDYERFLQRSLKRNLEERDKFIEKLGANHDARVHAIALGLRLQTENYANEAVIAYKQEKLAKRTSERDLNREFDRAEEDRKHVERLRRASAKLNELQGRSIPLGDGAADRRDARMDKQLEPESEYEATDDEIEPVIVKKTKKITPEKKYEEDVEEKKESIVAPPAVKPTGFLASLFSAMSYKDKPDDTPEVKVQKLARLAYHVKKYNPDYVLDDEEARALAAFGRISSMAKRSYDDG